jgi:hypothetical protein
VFWHCGVAGCCDPHMTFCTPAAASFPFMFFELAACVLAGVKVF